MKATRDAFGEQLLECAKNNPNIIGVNADLGKATKLSMLQAEFPERVVECGIAENNMIGVASGLAEHGFRVFIASFASFLTGKYDTIRCSLAYSKAPVVIVGSHGGLAIGKDGVTQMGLEDLSIMRSLPGMTVLNPATPEETKAMVRWLCDENNTLEGPVYLRIGRQPVKEVWGSNADYANATEYGNFDPNSTNVVKYDIGYDSDTIVLSSGCILGDVLDATEDLNIAVVNVSTLKPFSLDAIIEKYDKVVTVEDHSIIGGLGTTVAEEIATKGLGIKLLRIGLNDVFPESAPPADLYNKYGLSAEKIKAKIQEFMG